MEVQVLSAPPEESRLGSNWRDSGNEMSPKRSSCSPKRGAVEVSKRLFSWYTSLHLWVRWLLSHLHRSFPPPWAWAVNPAWLTPVRGLIGSPISPFLIIKKYQILLQFLKFWLIWCSTNFLLVLSGRLKLLNLN